MGSDGVYRISQALGVSYETLRSWTAKSGVAKAQKRGDGAGFVAVELPSKAAAGPVIELHALEYLWKATHVFFDEGTPEIETWVLERLERMLEGRISHVVAGMTRMATVRGLSAKQRAPVDKAAKYSSSARP